jgi:hypothetical protein
MTIQTVRPDATTSGASNFTPTGGASAQAVLLDNSDLTYIRKAGTGQKSIILNVGNYTVLGNETVKQVRLRARASTPTSVGKLDLQLGTRVNGVNYYFPSLTLRGTNSLATFTGAWQSSSPDGSVWDQTRLDALRAQITDYKDSGDRAFIYELYVDIETASKPTVIVDAPTGTITDTAKPDISWTYSDTDGESQTYYEAKVFSASQYGAVGFDPLTSAYTWSSGQISSTESTAQVGAYLASGTYRMYVRVAKTINGLPFFSDFAYSAFTVALTAPTIPTLTTSYNATSGVVLATLAGAFSATYTSQEYDLQRSDDLGATWKNVRYGTQVTPDGVFQASVSDYEAKRGQTAYYRCRSVGYVGVNVVASAWSSSSTVAIANDGKWWIKAPTDPSRNMGNVRVLHNIAMGQDEDLAVFRPLGRSYPIVISGALSGRDGSYKIITNGDAEWGNLYNLLTFQESVLVQAPDGTQKFIRITNRAWNERGAVGALIREVAVDYVETES